MTMTVVKIKKCRYINRLQLSLFSRRSNHLDPLDYIFILCYISTYKQISYKVFFKKNCIVIFIFNLHTSSSTLASPLRPFRKPGIQLMKFYMNSETIEV